MWELGSRQRPYEMASPTIISAVVPLGDREGDIEDCPPGYMELVKQCWDGDPQLRPNIDEVLLEIQRIKGNFESSLFMCM